MNEPSVSPAPLVEHALQSLRDRIPDAVAAQLPAAVEPTPDAAAEPVPPPAEPEAPATVETASAAPAVLGSAMDALRIVSASAQTRLADPDALPELPLGRDLSDLGPFVELVMREAQAAAAAYREQSARDTTARTAELLAAAAASADGMRRDADAYCEQARAAADALLAQRVRLIAELTGRLSQMAQRAGDEFADQKMRDQMMAFISALTATAQEAVTEVFPNTTSSRNGPRTEDAEPEREART